MFMTITSNERVKRAVRAHHNVIISARFSIMISMRLRDHSKLSHDRNLLFTSYNQTFDRWKNGKNESYYRNLALRVTHKHLRLHIGRPKTHSALLVQLRTENIEFNQFLCERRVLEVTTATCQCDIDRMIMKHVLLVCSQ